MSRRDALVLIAGATAAAGCTSGQAAARPDPVRSIEPLGAPPWKTLDPFLFCVHHDDAYPAGNERMGPAASLSGRSIGQDFANRDGWNMYHGSVVPGFPQHPHRGFETVTVVRRGLLDHADSLGATARYGEGDVQWLTAGRGINHAEMFPLLKQDAPNPVELFQIWINLPRANKMAAPHFSMFWAPEIPQRRFVDQAGRATQVTVVAGRLGDGLPPAPPPDSWASRPDADVPIWTIKLAPEARWTLPAAQAGTNRKLYVFAGAGLRIGQREIPVGHGVELTAELEAELVNGGAETEILLLQGRPIGEPVVQHGPFVMNSVEEIHQTIADYRRTRFGGWPWQSEEPVHQRDEGRFARLIDGRLVRPA